jgi:hypothetical protein
MKSIRISLTAAAIALAAACSSDPTGPGTVQNQSGAIGSGHSVAPSGASFSSGAIGSGH